MKLYKLENNEIVEELYGASLTTKTGYTKLTDAEAQKLRDNVLAKKLDNIKTETEKIQNEKNTIIETKTKELEPLLSKDTLTQAERKDIEKLFGEINIERDKIAEQILQYKDTILAQDTKEQIRTKEIIEQAKDTAKKRAEVIAEKQKEYQMVLLNNQKKAKEKLIELREDAIQKIRKSNMSTELKEQEILKLKNEIALIEKQ